MLTAHTVAQIRAAEESAAVEASWPELMRRAAHGLAGRLAFIPAGEAVLVLVGPGNNGGDALFAAVELLDRGVRIRLGILDPTRVHADGLRAALDAGAEVVERPDGERWVIDALFGIGARPGLVGRARQWCESIADSAHVIAVDVPSGVDVDGGAARNAHIRADRTITFGSYKPCLLLGPAADEAAYGSNAVPELVDIGLRPHLGRAVVEALEPSDHRLLRSVLFNTETSHKYTRGVVGIAAGSSMYVGAAHLAVAGAQAGPAGMVRFVGPEDLMRRVVDRAPEVVAGRGRVQAWVVGPGGGDEANRYLTEALADSVPVVVDADALRFIPDRFDVPVLLTPHAGELATMIDVSRHEVEADPLKYAAAAASRWNATVLLKGKRTLIAAEGHPVYVNLSGTPWLGTAGSGDVLAGFAGSLLAAGLAPRDAGALAAFLHGAAGVRANPGGPITASAIAAVLPSIVAEFLAGTLHNERRWV